MNRVFIDLYLDEDVDVLISGLIRIRGFNVTTTQEARQLGSTDAQQLAFAAANRRALLTHNRVDFEVLAERYFDEKKTHSGIIIAVRRKPQEVARRILFLLNSFTVDEIENQIKYV